MVTLGCMIQKMDFNQISMSVQTSTSIQTSDVAADGNSEFSSSAWQFIAIGTGFVFIMIQVCCSVFAGVYNEYLIKNVAGSEVDIMIQNVFMYLDSIVCNLVVLGLKGDLTTAFSSTSLSSINQPFVLAIILNNSLVGIVTSLFLKNLNSILKSFASALELIFTAVFSFVLLGIPIYFNTAVAVAIVSYAVVLYAQNPVKNVNTSKSSSSGGSNQNSPRKDVVIHVMPQKKDNQQR